MNRSALGLRPLVVLGLAALGLPRAIAHDLSLMGPVVNAVLVFAPIAVWLGYVLWRRVPNPFLALLAVGVVYGVLLAIAHQVLWAPAYGGNPPALGGELAGALPPLVEALVLRGAAVLSSLLTGVVLGAVLGGAGWLLSRALPAGPRAEQR